MANTPKDNPAMDAKARADGGRRHFSTALYDAYCKERDAHECPEMPKATAAALDRRAGEPPTENDPRNLPYY